MTKNKTEGGMRFRILDSWRGIAALTVALFHLNVLSPIYSLDVVRNGFLFVDFFFVLSGFVITHSYGERLGTIAGVDTFVFRRFCRLWPLHGVVLLAFVAVESAKAVAAARGANFYAPPFTGATSAGAVVVNLLFGQAIGIENQLTWNTPSWSIAAEFWTYVIFAAALYLATAGLSRFRFAAEGLLAMLLIGSVAVLVAGSNHGQDATYDLGLFRCLYGFLVGHFVYRLWRLCPPTLFDSSLIEIAVLIIAFSYVSFAGHSAFSFLAPLVFAIVVLVFAFEAGPVSRLMSNPANEWLGKISYSIYMWQAFIIFNLVDRGVSMVEKLTHRVLTTTEGASSALGGEAGKLIVLGGHVLPILMTAVFLAVLVAVASLSYRLIERPVQEWARTVRWGDGQAETESQRLV
jgi:peptidoglycan/LPS O-acetylase OafA/YrhL